MKSSGSERLSRVPDGFQGMPLGKPTLLVAVARYGSTTSIRTQGRPFTPLLLEKGPAIQRDFTLSGRPRRQRATPPPPAHLLGVDMGPAAFMNMILRIATTSVIEVSNDESSMQRRGSLVQKRESTLVV